MIRCGIYRITVAGECYLGQSQNMPKRWNEHRRLLRAGAHHSRHLQAAIARHGIAAARFEVVEAVPVDMLDERERFWVLADRPALNMRLDDIRGASRGHKLRPETIAKLRGRRLSDQHRANISAAQTGKQRTPEAAFAAAEARRRAMAARVAAGLPAQNPNRARRCDAIATVETLAAIRAAWVPRKRGGGSVHGPTIRSLAKQYGVSYPTAWNAIHKGAAR